MTWTGTITAPSTGDYVLKLQTAGGRGTLTLDTPPPLRGAAADARSRARRTGWPWRRRYGSSARRRPIGLSNPSTPVHFDAGVARPITITGTAGGDDADAASTGLAHAQLSD